MNEHATPAPATPTPPVPGHQEAPHHLSPWPIVAGTFAAVFAVGIVLHPIVAFLGLIGTFAGIAGWVREDMHFFHHPQPEFFHHGKAPNPFWGVILFLGTEVMLFGGLFFAYFAGRGAALAEGEAWPEARLPVFATFINTVILVSSGATMHFAMLSIQHDRRKPFLVGLGLTILLGAVFLGQQVREYITLVRHDGVTLGSSNFGSTFYALTGTHGLHVFGGLVAIAIVLFRALRGQFSKDRYLLVEGAAFYWHFVDVVWIFLFTVIYLGWI